MRKLVIIGAGGLGRETLGYALAMEQTQKDWKVSGFIDDNPDALKDYHLEVSIMGNIADYIPKEDEYFICALGDPKRKLEICRKLEKRGAVFINLLHPTAVIGHTSRYGKGLIMAPYSVITENVILGDFITINAFSGFGHDSVAEDGCTLSGHCDVTGFAYLEEGVFLSSHAMVAPGVRIGRYAKIGPGSVALKDVKANSVLYGIPAKVVF